jgi:hypothetical protein
VGQTWLAGTDSERPWRVIDGFGAASRERERVSKGESDQDRGGIRYVRSGSRPERASEAQDEKQDGGLQW